MQRQWYLIVLAAMVSLFAACSSVPSRVSESSPLQAPRTEDPVVSAPTESRQETERLAAELALLLRQAQLELLTYQEIIASSNQVARTAVQKGKVTDYAFCVKIPPDLTRVKHYATHGALVVNLYRGRCIHHVEGFIDEQKFKNRKEMLLPPKKK